MIKSGDFVSCIKLSFPEDAVYPTPTWEEYAVHVPGTYVENSTIPVNYCVTGELLYDIDLGSRVNIFRASRNGEKVDGWFQTSKVRSVTYLSEDELMVETNNSYYSIKKIERGN